jgi:hypothetical protein
MRARTGGGQGRVQSRAAWRVNRLAVGQMIDIKRSAANNEHI